MSYHSSMQFYQRLPVFTDFAELTRSDWYQPLPDDWWLVLADIRASTRAINDGRYRDVNSVSAAAMVAVLNACRPCEVPYAFGGDGISVACPPECQQAVGNALLAVQELARREFRLDLRIALIPVLAVRVQGVDVTVARYQPSPHFAQAMFQGGGLALAEQWLKQPDLPAIYRISELAYQPLADFSGYECRWQTVPSHRDETLSLLVQPLSSEPQARGALYRQVLEVLESICGSEADYHPLQERQLKLVSTPRDIETEARIRLPDSSTWQRWCYRWRVFLLLLAGRYLMKTDQSENGWRGYRQRLLANSDFQKCDDQLRMVIAVDREQRVRLLEWLQQQHSAGRLVYGVHVSDAALMTCLVTDYVNNHVHFLDGDKGGYALAAQGLKQQLATLAAASG